MIESPDLTPLDPHLDPISPQVDHTVDLTLDGMDEVDDLQALADQVADITPDTTERRRAPRPAEPAPTPEPGPTADVMDRIVAELERELDDATKRLHALEKQESEQMDKHHRLLADFANYRNRTGRDIQLAVDLSERKLLMELIPVSDNFERCIAATYTSVDDCRNGVALIHKQFLDSLKRMGVENIQVQIGDPFDAQFAEALTTTTNPQLPDGSIAAIFEAGYKLRDQLLRPARVVVNHLPENPDIALPSNNVIH
ncbi:MAG: nucleotide exchange factor GrpE [Holophaga sp.]|nr:nucleotide exchange factor GrpE [Holophaga sp.]